VLIIGPPQSGKTELLMKLTGKRISNYPDPSFSADEIRIGLKESFLSNQELHVTEFWDVPVSKLESISHITSRVKFVLLLYDCNSRDSFKKMKDLFSEIYCLPSLASASYLCIATKDDYQFTRAMQRGLPRQAEEEEEEEGDDEALGRFLRLKRQEEDLGPCHAELKAGRTWAKERGFRYVPISSRYNYGITTVLRALRSR
jgi:GTPase SAR1 family protein